MSYNSTRREFIGRCLRLGGLFASSSAWTAWNFNLAAKAAGSSFPVRDRLLISEPEKLIEAFLEATGGSLVYYCQMFFPTFITGGEIEKVSILARLCAERMTLADRFSQARLHVIPAIAAANMLPTAKGADAQNLCDVISKTHQEAKDEIDSRQFSLGFLWTCMTAALVRNPYNWRELFVGKDILNAATDICLTFTNGEDATLPLIHTAISSWQFLLTYQRALIERQHPSVVTELEIVTIAILKVKRVIGKRSIWLHRVEELYTNRMGYSKMLPEYLETIIGRSYTKIGSIEREVADFFVLVRLQLMHANFLIESGKIKSSYLLPDAAREMKNSVFALLVNYGVTPDDWSMLKIKGEHFLTTECIKYLDSIFGNYDKIASQSCIVGEEMHYSQWFSKNAPFRDVWPEESAAAVVYSEPKALESSLEALRDPNSLDARLAFCTPAILYGCTMESSTNIAINRKYDIVEAAKSASLNLLSNSQYTQAFKLLADQEPNFRNLLIAQKTTISVRHNLADMGRVKPLRGKEKMEEIDQNPNVIIHNALFETVNHAVPYEELGQETQAGIRKHFLESAQKAGIPENEATRFIDAKEQLVETSDSMPYEKIGREMKAGIRKHFLESAQKAGIPENEATKFIDPSSCNDD